MLSRGASPRTVVGVVTLLALASLADPTRRAVAAASHHVRVNGVPMVWREVTVRGTPQSIAPRLLARWQAQFPDGWGHTARYGRRIVVGYRHRRLTLSASVLPAASRLASRVVISATDTSWPVRPMPRVRSLRLPGGSAWISATESAPGGARTVEYLGVSQARFAVSRLRWIAALRRAGFDVDPTPAVGPIDARRGSEWLWLLLQPQGAQTAITMQQRWLQVGEP